ncbi:riboflavin synthase [Lentisphaerota bacterium ZTH]|nr:riboflavin synthase [Lentisphaerota bacterium]WET06249.1 riboflavin synthase [Lentisphaerota bacterium ZTH]
MFTGLIQTTARLLSRNSGGGSGKLCLKPEKPFDKLEFGESIAVNGCCLTLEKEKADGALEFHTLGETLSRTNLGAVPVGGRVNLERAMQLGARLGGHIVTGHIDTTAEFIGTRKVGGDIEYRVALPEELKPFMAAKGSIAIDGVSLTLVDIADDSFSVHLIPVTLQETALGDRKPGDRVNLEADLLGKYVQRQLSCFLSENKTSNINMDILHKAGW